ATGDGDLIVAVFVEKFWSGFCRALGRPQWERDPRFLTNRDRVVNRETLMPLVEAEFRTRTTAEWLRRLQAEGVPAAPIQSVDRVLEDLQVRRRGMVVEMEHPVHGRLPTLGTPVKVDGAMTVTVSPPPRLGQQTDLVLRELPEACEGAEVLIAPLPATSHDELAKRLAPHVNERQIVLLTPGTLGSMALARGLARAGGSMPGALAETGTLPYLTRKTGPAEVRAAVRAANLPTGVFPASRTDAVLARLAELFPAMRRCADALDVALTNAGPVIHPPLVLLNTGPIDGGRF